MIDPTPAAGGVPAKSDDRDGPLPPLLLILTFITGLVDAISYLNLGHVFVANMTGNVVFLGFALAGATDFSAPASLAALAAFLVGALAGGYLGARTGQHRGRYLAVIILVQILLVGVALVIPIALPAPNSQLVQYGLIVMLALAMGLQNAAARRLAVADLTTTVLTLTLTGLAADSSLVGGKNPRPGRRLTAAVTMLLGAALGAFLVLNVGIISALALTLALLALSGIASYRAARSSEPWTVAA